MSETKLWHPGTTGDLTPPGFRPAPPHPNSSIYQVAHPTRYAWRDDVEELIRRIYRKFGGPDVLHINTYVCHPEGWCRDTTSFDVWGPGGRNYPIGYDLGNRVFNYIFYDPNPPYIEWCIWRRRMWTRTFWGWQPFGTDPFSFHDDHIHVTLTGWYRQLS